MVLELSLSFQKRLFRRILKKAFLRKIDDSIKPGIHLNDGSHLMDFLSTPQIIQLFVEVDNGTSFRMQALNR